MRVRVSGNGFGEGLIEGFFSFRLGKNLGVWQEDGTGLAFYMKQ